MIWEYLCFWDLRKTQRIWDICLFKLDKGIFFNKEKKTFWKKILRFMENIIGFAINPN